MKNKIIAMVVLAILIIATITFTTIMGNNASGNAECIVKFAGNNVSVSNVAMAYAEDCAVTLGKSGTYRISGDCNNGAIIVDTMDAQDVILIFDNLNISSESYSALNVVNAVDVYIELVGNNIVSDGIEYAGQVDGKPNACIFSKKDLHINGDGSLQIIGNYHHGLSVRADLSIASGNITITSAANGIDVKNSFKMNGGDIAITAGGDGISAKNSDEPILSQVDISGGHIDINSMDEGITSSGDLIVSGGNHVITSKNQMFRVGGDSDIKKECITAR